MPWRGGRQSPPLGQPRQCLQGLLLLLLLPVVVVVVARGGRSRRAFLGVPCLLLRESFFPRW